jgi:hypothetical protein
MRALPFVLASISCSLSHPPLPLDAGLQQLDAGSLPEQCGLEGAAFCETFETPSPGGRGGDLDETRWGFARWGHTFGAMHERIPASTYPDQRFPATFCGAPFSNIGPDRDVRACSGIGYDGQVSMQLNEVFDDQEDYGLNSMMIRQPFDFAGRTGRLVWDVDGKRNPCTLGRGWWIEVWITEDPQPLPIAPAPTVAGYPRRGVGFTFRFGGFCPATETAWGNQLETVHVIDDYEPTATIDLWDMEQLEQRCFRTMDTRLNHFELRISQNEAELWASDFDDPSSLRLRTRVPGLDLPFTRGYVHFHHAQYNANRDSQGICDRGHGVSRSQTYRWDNIAFDGPRLSPLRAFDVPDPLEPGSTNDRGVQALTLGWYFESEPLTIVVPNVDPSNATAAQLSFFVGDFGAAGTLSYAVNGHAPHVFALPVGEHDGERGVSVPVPLAEVIAGDNIVELSSSGRGPRNDISNIDLSFVVR